MVLHSFTKNKLNLFHVLPFLQIKSTPLYTCYSVHKFETIAPVVPNSLVIKTIFEIGPLDRPRKISLFTKDKRFLGF